NNMINTKKTTIIETTWDYKLEYAIFTFSQRDGGVIRMELHGESPVEFDNNELDSFIDGMTAFRDALKDNKKIPEKEFIVSEEEAEAVIAHTYKESE
ncbi:unnamed protein product, partial [marine sediment metagenome]